MRNTATTVLSGCWAGTSRSVTSVITPSTPSLPTNNLVRLSPATSFSRGPPSRTAVPSASTTCTPEHVVGGDAVFHAAQAARIGRDVAADAADLVRRRVRRIPQAVLGDGLLDLGVEQPGLADRGARNRVDDDVAHLLRRQHDPAVDGGGAAGQAGAHAAGHHRNLVGGGPAHHGLHLFGAARYAPRPAVFRPTDPARGPAGIPR